MATYQQLEEIRTWQKARLLTREIYRITQRSACRNDYGLKDQMRRAAISVMSNIAEGFERNGTKEFLHFLAVAKGSAGELRAQLYIALDQQYIDQPTFDVLIGLISEISKMLGGLIIHLSKTDFTGSKYK